MVWMSRLAAFLQQSLHLHPVFAHNIDKVAAGLAGPILFGIQSAELAETIGGEEDFFACDS